MNENPFRCCWISHVLWDWNVSNMGVHLLWEMYLIISTKEISPQNLDLEFDTVDIRTSIWIIRLILFTLIKAYYQALTITLFDQNICRFQIWSTWSKRKCSLAQICYIFVDIFSGLCLGKIFCDLYMFDICLYLFCICVIFVMFVQIVQVNITTGLHLGKVLGEVWM